MRALNSSASGSRAGIQNGLRTVQHPHPNKRNPQPRDLRATGGPVALLFSPRQAAVSPSTFNFQYLGVSPGRHLPFSPLFGHCIGLFLAIYCKTVGQKASGHRDAGCRPHPSQGTALRRNTGGLSWTSPLRCDLTAPFPSAAGQAPPTGSRESPRCQGPI